MDNSSFEELSIYLYLNYLLKITALARMGTASFCEPACFCRLAKDTVDSRIKLQKKIISLLKIVLKAISRTQRTTKLRLPLSRLRQTIPYILVAFAQHLFQSYQNPKIDLTQQR